MKSQTPQHVIDASAFIHASHRVYDPLNEEWTCRCVSILRETCAQNFPGDTALEDDVIDCALYALDKMQQAYPKSRAAQVSVLRWCSEFADHVEPDGRTRRTNGIAALLKSRRHETDRRSLFRRNFVNYSLMAIEQHQISLLVPCPFHGTNCPTVSKFREETGST